MVTRQVIGVNFSCIRFSLRDLLTTEDLRKHRHVRRFEIFCSVRDQKAKYPAY